MDASRIAAALGGEVVGRDRVVAPGPGHSKRDRSLSILLSPAAPRGLVVTSHAGDGWRECRDYVFDRLGVTPETARDALPQRVAPADDGERTARALDLWEGAFDPRRSPVEAYLAFRGIELPADACMDALRWHPACPFGPGVRTGAMLALVRDVVTNKPKAVHRTAIAPDGTKRSDLGANGRLTLGPVGGGAVKLTPDADVTTVLGIGEGIESTLSLRKLPEFGATPVWALLAANQMARLPVLAGVDALWIAADHDPTGLAAARSLADRWRSREVFLVQPVRSKADLNDVVMEAAHAA